MGDCLLFKDALSELPMGIELTTVLDLQLSDLIVLKDVIYKAITFAEESDYKQPLIDQFVLSPVIQK